MDSKRRKISLFATHRARNAGADDSFLDPTTNPNLDIPSGSDTESEPDQEETAQKYLNKSTDDTNRPIETVFGAGMKVWRSMNGTMYAERLQDKMEKQPHQKIIWGEHGNIDGDVVMSKSEDGKRKRNGPRSGDWKQKRKTKQEQAKDEDQENEAPPGDVLYPTLPPSLLTPLFPRLPTSVPLPTSLISPTLSTPANTSTTPLPLLPPLTPYPPRNPTATRFHRSSAAIDPRGAYNRPIRPLPRRSERNKLSTPPTEVTRGIVSGSFGSFGEDMRDVDRFSERPYRLGQTGGGLARVDEVDEKEKGKGKGGGVKEEKEGGGGKQGNLFKGMQWLRRR